MEWNTVGEAVMPRKCTYHGKECTVVDRPQVPGMDQVPEGHVCIVCTDYYFAQRDGGWLHREPGINIKIVPETEVQYK